MTILGCVIADRLKWKKPSLKIFSDGLNEIRVNDIECFFDVVAKLTGNRGFSGQKVFFQWKILWVVSHPNARLAGRALHKLHQFR